jgi:hypothetical protein
MKRLILALIAMGVPAVVSAQQASQRQATEGFVVAGSAPAAAASAAVQAGAATPPPRRRPSMVGYIENASIENRLRVRFDSGQGINAADRAEFFYAKCGCYRGLPAVNPAFDPDAAGPGPGVLTEADYVQFTVYGEYALNPRLSVVGELPIRGLRPQSFVPGTGSFGNTSGLSDLRGGVKVGLASDGNRQLTLLGLVSAPTGDSREGLGTNHWSLEPALLYGAQFADRLGVEAELGAVLPAGGSHGIPTSASDKFSGKVIYYGVGPSVDLYRSAAASVAPVVEIVGWHVLDGFGTADGGRADGTDIVNLKLGGRVAFGQHSIYVGWGKALTDAVWYDHLIRVEYRVGF